jgi:hypothetical protein
MDQGGEDRRAKVLADYRKTLLQHKEVDAKVRPARRRGRSGARQLAADLGQLPEHGRDGDGRVTRRGAHI